MIHRRKSVAVLGTLITLVLVACLGAQHEMQDAEHAGGSQARRAIAVIAPTEGSTASGIVTFTQVDEGVRVVANISGLNPNSKHAIHVHEFGDVSSADGTAAGGHYNPEGHPHALPTNQPRHAGDFGNLEANAQGMAHLELLAENITIDGRTNPVLGRAVIVHAEPDDGGQPTGNAGARIGQGVIGLAGRAD